MRGLGLGLGFNRPNGGASFLSTFAGSTAAYSLRQLATASTAVARVRRASDDAEQDFTAAQVSGSGMLDFVVPADVRALYGSRMNWGLAAASDYVSIPLATDFFNGGNTISLTAVQPAENPNRLYERDAQSGAGQSFRALLGSTVVDGKVEVFFRHRFSGTAGGDAIWSTTNSCFVLGEINTVSITYDSSSITNDPVIVVNGVTEPITETTAPVGGADIGAGALYLGNNEAGGGSSFGGTIYDVTIGTSVYEGYGITNADWEDQVNSNDGTVNGSPTVFTGQGFNGAIPIWYDQHVPTSQDYMYFDGSSVFVNLGAGDPLSFNGTGKVGAKAVIVVGANPSSTEDIFYNYINATNIGFSFDIQTNGTIRVAGRSEGGDGFESFASTNTVNVGSENTIEVYVDYQNNEFGVKINDNAFETGSATFNNSTYTAGTTTNNTRIGNSEFLGRFFTGIIKDIEVYKDDVLSNSYIGNGNTNANWEDQTGSVDGTVNGSPARCDINLNIAADAVQDTADSQPMIVEDGALVTKNGKPGVKVDGVDDYMQASVDGLQDYTDLYTFIVNSPTLAAAADTTTVIPFGFGQSGSDEVLSWGQTTASLANETVTLLFENSTFTAGRLGSSSYSRSAGQQELLTTSNLSTGTKLYQNGIEVALNLASGINTSTDTSPSSTGYTADNDLYLFAYESGSGINQSPEAIFQEFIVFDSDQAANRTDIENNIKNYWGIS